MSSRGFTLIELMIAVAIIGILAAVALPSYRESVAQSHGGGAMKGVASQAQKALICVQSGFDCTGVAADIAAIDELSLIGGPLADAVGGTLSWDNNECIVSAVITNDGILTYSATNSAGAVTTAAQCQAGAGL